MCFSITSCCYCISLEIGAQIIGIFSLLVALAETGYCIWSAAVLPLSQIKMITVFVVVAVMALFEAFCACLLIRGVFAKKASNTIPWIVLAWVKSVACLVVATVGIVILAVHSESTPEPPSVNPDDPTTMAPTAPTNVTEAVTTKPAGIPVDSTKWTVTFIVIVVVCIIEALLLMYFALVVNSRRKHIRDDDYSHYAPVRTDSIRNVFVPITKQAQQRPTTTT